jgi:hypothetical protein
LRKWFQLSTPALTETSKVLYEPRLGSASFFHPMRRADAEAKSQPLDVVNAIGTERRVPPVGGTRQLSEIHDASAQL